jgi:hypothetical protein
MQLALRRCGDTVHVMPALDLDGITTNAFTRFAMRQGRPIRQGDPRFRDEREKWSATAAVHEAQRGRKSVSSWELEEVARIYNENVEGGNPTQAVKEGMDYNSLRTAARRVQQCRRPEVGLLPPTTRGKKRGTREDVES